MFIDGDVVEKRLGIPPDYQYRALRSAVFIQRNWHSHKYLAIQSAVVFNPTDKVLNLGTGSGNFELLFADRVGSIVGVDYNDEALAFLRKKLAEEGIGNVDLVEADVRNLPEEVLGRRYELITLVDVLEHLEAAAGEKLLAKLRPLLSPRGKIVIITPNYGSFWPLIELVLDRLTNLPRFRNGQHLTKYDRKNLAILLGRCGFRNIKYFTFNALSYLMPGEPISRLFFLLEKKAAGDKGCLVLVEASA